MKDIIQALESQGQGAKFISFTYTAKKHGEKARYTLAMGVNYSEVCQRDITELEIRLQTAKGIESFCLQAQIDSLKESILAREEGREHKDYTKKGLYRSICPGVKINLNDNSLEIQGFQHAKAVLIPGDYKETNYRSEETRMKADIRKSLKVGKFKTLCLDAGLVHSARINGETIELD